MTSDAPVPTDASLGRPKFPIILTGLSAVVLAILLGLGVWQVQRAEWKSRQLAGLAALRAAPPVPIAPVLAKAAAGKDVSFTRVVVDCAPETTQPFARMSSEDGQWITRPLAACLFDAPPYGGIVLDRGVLEASKGQVALPGAALSPPGHVIGVLRPPLPMAGVAGIPRPAPWVLAVEQETPAPPGVTPAPAEIGAADNLQYVGAYAPTWFGLAGVLVCMYAAMLWRRYRPTR